MTQARTGVRSAGKNTAHRKESSALFLISGICYIAVILVASLAGMHSFL